MKKPSRVSFHGTCREKRNQTIKGVCIMKQRFTTRKLAFLGMMTALVFASNYARIIMPIAIGGRTSFTLANIVCCLSGLLLGPIGGLASGLGSALYDLTNPLYAAECWITFLTKGLMGTVAGLVVARYVNDEKLAYPRCLLGAVLGCVAYYILYFFKSVAYDGVLVEGLQPMVALAALPLKFPASIFNAAVAIIAAPPLCIALRAALRRSGLSLKTA